MNIGYETESMEFKKTTSELKEGVISLSSMLNKNGFGTLYFGVKNDGEAVGQEIGDQTLRDVSRIIAQYIKPQVVPSITLELVDGKNVIKVEAEGSEKPYSAYGRYYIRSADEDREMEPAQLMHFMQEKENTDVITTIVSENQNLTFSQLKTLFTTKEVPVNEAEFENNLGFFTKNKKYNLMAELLADRNDISIKVVTFAGKDKNEIIRRNEYGFKCLALALDQVLNYMESLNDTKITLGTHQREEEKLFDFAAFKEAWQNACLHTKWQKKNPPAVYIFSDRIEIISTGGLAPDLSKEEFYRGISRPVNAKLQKIFGQLGFVEQTGHGIPLIINRYGIQAFDLMENFLNVTIPFNKAIVREKEEYFQAQGSVSKNDSPQNQIPQKLSDSQKKLLQFLKKKPYATNKEIEEAFSFSNAYIRKLISKLKELGLIKRSGSNRKGYWEVLR
ncbi:MAG: putative DNA binding domain-containing protein [Treponemataceae bacterium]|nr:putative DNA binding domain-containing protein [Treponemataceae bacterium]